MPNINLMSPNINLMSVHHTGTLDDKIGCLNYSKLAPQNEVSMIAASNSLTCDACSSNMINNSISELEQYGIVSVFASDNDTMNSFKTLTTCNFFPIIPYVITIESIIPNGNFGKYSNYAVVKTDVYALESLILPTCENSMSTSQ